MSFWTRLIGRADDPRDELRPLWHQSVAVSREPHWYEAGPEQSAVEDSVEGRIDMIMAVLGLVILRMETSPQLGPKTALITELFVADMDRQLREKGVGDLMVGKNIGKLMEMLGGRLGATRTALQSDDNAALEAALLRNMTLTSEGPPTALATSLRALHGELGQRSDDQLQAGILRG